MRKGWDIRIAILLLLLGGICLFASTTFPFSSGNGWFQQIHLIEIAMMILLSIFFWFYFWSNRVGKRKIPCPTCRYHLVKDWRFCPQCGSQIQIPEQCER
ncbi:hypothetical protein SAMN04487866_12819 [Thermoactinomyces sp. DSM 45891]|uniref:hypothetical protein n=1 Tax=Thermoactinomyces sp. DSM 45891 TaxID=1761907 RepID=UPI000916D531|nr:hypothetical protein [Thermoactinomyces sp. DSM 45891]SFX80977.1 hypothetical protein SAMN04487866_12819 [Thermoactinomyces sp. DSM 45891]